MLLTHTEAHMIELIEQLRQKSRLNNLKLVPKKSFHMFLRVGFPGHNFEISTINRVHLKAEAITKLKTPTMNRDL